MKKSIIVVIAAVLLSQVTLSAAQFNKQKEHFSIAMPAAELTNGEYLSYAVEWLGIPAGVITLRVSGVENFNGKQCYHVIARALPNSFFASFYDIEYVVHSYIDIQNLQPQRFQKIRRYRDSINNTTIDFDWQLNKAIFSSKGSELGIEISPLKRKIERELPLTEVITKDTQDLLSSIYYFRLLKIEDGKVYPFSIYYGQRNWPVELNIGKPYLRDFRKMGSFSVFQVSVGSIITDFILGKRKFAIYFTTNSRRIPLEFEVGTAIGSIRCRLQKLPQ